MHLSKRGGPSNCTICEVHRVTFKNKAGLSTRSNFLRFVVRQLFTDSTPGRRVGNSRRRRSKSSVGLADVRDVASFVAYTKHALPSGVHL